jgi:hypothetical protein
MFRFRLLLALLILLTMLPFRAAAQSGPDPDEPIDWQTLAEDTEISVNRTYEVDQGGSSGLFDGDLVQLYAIGIVNATRADARASYNVVDDYLLASFQAGAEDEGFFPDDPESIAIDPIGDQSEAWNIEGTVEGNPLTLNFSLVIVQQEAWVQVLTGVGFGDPQVETLVEIAVDMDGRWPNQDPVTLDGDEMRVGGPWAMVPQPVDLPSELEWVERADTGPEVTSGDGSGTVETDEGTSAEPDVPVPDAVKGEDANDTPAPDGAEPAGEGEEPGAGDDASAAPDAHAAATPVPAEDPIAPAGPDAPEDAEPTAAPPDRLVSSEPAPATLWIILPAGAFAALDETSCAGAGAYDGLRPGGVITLLNQEGATHIESAMLEANGAIFYDTVLRQDVCAFMVEFTAVPPGATVLVDIERVVLGQFVTNGSSAGSGEPPVYEIVVGA